MNAPPKLRRLHAANDRPVRSASPRLSIVTSAWHNKTLGRLLIGVVLLLFCGLMGLTIELTQKTPEPATRVTAALTPQPVQPAKPAVPAKMTDIILPASGLRQDIPPPEDAAINVIAAKISDLPALNGPASVHAVIPNQEDNHDTLMRAHHLLGTKNYHAAVDLYARILASDSENHDALAGKAFALAAEGDNEDAIAANRRLLALYPNDDAAAANLAHILQLSDQNEEAITYLDRAARIAPTNLAYRFQLAGLYDRNGHAGEALMLYRQVIDSAQRDENSEIPVAALQRRIDYLERREADAAAAGEPSTTRPVDN